MSAATREAAELARRLSNMAQLCASEAQRLVSWSCTGACIPTERVECLADSLEALKRDAVKLQWRTAVMDEDAGLPASQTLNLEPRA